MEPFEHDVEVSAPVQQPGKQPHKQHPPAMPGRVLIVTADTRARDILLAELQQRCHRSMVVTDAAAAAREIARSSVDVIMIDAEIAQPDTFTLLSEVARTQPATRAIMFSTSTEAGAIIGAVRAGAVDFIDIAHEQPHICARVQHAIEIARRERRREQRFEKLQRICKELNDARHEVSGQVESLCDELVVAYQEMAGQIDDVTVATEFRTLLQQELDAEDVLRTALEYLLTKTGPTNAAVFLPDEDGQFNLGAYVNYDCPRDSVSLLLDHLCAAICPQMAREQDIVAFNDAREFGEWIGFESDFMDDSQVVAFSCRHHGECLAVVVLFRSSNQPYEDELAGTLDLLRTIFAQQLSKIITLHHRAAPQWPGEGNDDEIDFDDFDDFGFNFGDGGGGVAA